MVGFSISELLLGIFITWLSVGLSMIIFVDFTLWLMGKYFKQNGKDIRADS